MESWLPLLIGALIVFILHQRQQCIDEGRPFFRAGRRASGRQRTQSALSEQNLGRTTLRQQSQQKYSQRAGNTHNVPLNKNRPSVNEDAFSPKRAASQPAPDVMVRTDLVRQLNALTHNEATAKRLIFSLKQRHPERSLDWCAERAINDIERDRR